MCEYLCDYTWTVDLNSAYDHVQKVAKENTEEEEPDEEEKPEIPESQLHMLYQAIAEQFERAKAFWMLDRY